MPKRRSPAPPKPLKRKSEKRPQRNNPSSSKNQWAPTSRWTPASNTQPFPFPSFPSARIFTVLIVVTKNPTFSFSFLSHSLPSLPLVYSPFSSSSSQKNPLSRFHSTFPKTSQKKRYLNLLLTDILTPCTCTI